VWVRSIEEAPGAKLGAVVGDHRLQPPAGAGEFVGDSTSLRKPSSLLTEVPDRSIASRGRWSLVSRTVVDDDDLGHKVSCAAALAIASPRKRPWL
jgi:hypothetical protein